jgi:tetratricopeptide (TPR) repeat protein
MPSWCGVEAGEWLARLERDIENVRAALGWCIAQVETGESEAMDLLLRLGNAMSSSMYPGSARERRHELSSILSRLQAAAYPQARAQALLRAGTLAEIAGSIAQADDLYEEALTLARATGNTPLLIWTLVQLGMTRTDPAQRREDLEEALDLAQRTITDDRAADEDRRWNAQIFVAVHHLDVGDLSRSRTLAEEVHTQAAARENLNKTHMALDVLANVARAEGDTATARRLFAESLTMRRAMGDKHSAGHTLRFLGEIAEEQGETEQAGMYNAEALVVLRDAWDVNRIAAVLRGVAALALMAGEPARALRLAGAVNVVHATHGTRIFMEVAPAQKLWARTSWEQIRETAQQALSPADAAAAWAEGQAMSLEQAIAYALDWLPTTVS